MIASLAFCVIFVLDNGKEILLVNYDYLKKYGSGSSDLRRIFDLEDSDHEMNHLKEWVTFFGFVGNIEIMCTANILCGQQMTV